MTFDIERGHKNQIQLVINFAQIMAHVKWINHNLHIHNDSRSHVAFLNFEWRIKFRNETFYHDKTEYVLE